MDYEFKSDVWVYDGQSAWHFATLPKLMSKEIKDLFGSDKPGWGAVPVKVTVNSFSWKTSIFPDKKAGAYLLPLKAEARKSAGINNGDKILVKIIILA